MRKCIETRRKNVPMKRLGNVSRRGGRITNPPDTSIQFSRKRNNLVDSKRYVQRFLKNHTSTHSTSSVRRSSAHRPVTGAPHQILHPSHLFTLHFSLFMLILHFSLFISLLFSAGI
jgi:hypothetical protein